MTATSAPPRPTTPRVAEAGTTTTDAAGTPPGGGPGPRRRLRRPAVNVVGIFVVGAVIPVAVALVRVRSLQWFPAMDFALVELRLRDISEGNMPLVGPYARLGAGGDPSYHPGPLMYWTLFPVYWLLGQTAWALQVATGLLNLVAVAAAAWLGYRRGGPPVAFAMVLGTVLLARSYGFEKLLTPWNPYVAALWWVVLLLAVWSLLCRDLPMLPIAVWAASLCLQSHYGYVGLVGVVLTLGTIGMVAAAGPDRGSYRGGRWRWPWLIGWLLPSALLGVVLWTGPLIDQATNDPGNLEILWEATLNGQPAGDPRPLAEAADVWLAHRNPLTLLSHTADSISIAPDGPGLPGLVLLATFAVAVCAAWRFRLAAANRLHLVIGGAMGGELLSIQRITDAEVRDYVVLWAWGTTLLVVVAIGLVVASVVGLHADPLTPSGRRIRAFAALFATATLAVAAVAFTVDATRPRFRMAHEQQPLLAEVGPTTIASLERPGGVLGFDENDTFVVMWGDDALWSGMAGYGFMLELARSGLDVRATGPISETQMGSHRTLDPVDADAAIHLVIGPRYIERWQRTPDATQVGYYEPRSAEEMQEYMRLDHELRWVLGASGRADLSQVVDGSLTQALFSGRLPTGVPRLLDRMLELGLPVAVFVAPAGVHPVA